MAENPEQKSGDLIPPKLDLRKSGIVKDKPLPAAAGIPSASAGLTSKRETSRIPLEVTTAAGVAEAGGAPKTIRIKPAAALGTIGIGKPEGAAPVAAPAAESPEKSAVAKRTTSRISLDAVLGEAGEAAPAGDSGPRTIRLKRPGEAPALNFASAAGASEADGEGGPPTVRKTIRVKRTSMAPAGQAAAVARPAGGESAAAVDAMAAAPETVGFIWPAVALLAVLAAIGVVWMLCAQVFGPDLSMTQLASGAMRGLDLPWPGKIAAIR